MGLPKAAEAGLKSKSESHSKEIKQAQERRASRSTKSSPSGISLHYLVTLTVIYRRHFGFQRFAPHYV